MASKDLVIKLKLKPATAAELAAAFAGVQQAAQKAGGGAGGGGRRAGGIGGALKSIFGGGALGGLGETVGGGLQAAAGALPGVGVALAGVGLAAVLAGKAFGALQESLGRLAHTALETVQKANPSVIEKLNIAWEDMQAVIGHALVPVVELLTDATRLWGDVLASILPSTAEMRYALQPFKDALNDLRPALAEITPVIRDLISLGVRALGEALHWLQGQFHAVIGSLGLSGQLTSSVGAAARPLNFTTQDAAAKDVYKAAYLASAKGGGQERDIPTILGSLQEKVLGIWDGVKNVAAVVEAGVGRLLAKLDTATGGLLTGIGKLLAPLANAVGDVFRATVNAGKQLFDGFTSLMEPLAGALADLADGMANVGAQLRGIGGDLARAFGKVVKPYIEEVSVVLKPLTAAIVLMGNVMLGLINAIREMLPFGGKAGKGMLDEIALEIKAWRERYTKDGDLRGR